MTFGTISISTPLMILFYWRRADGQKTISYQAYYTSASQDIEKVENGVTYWGEIEVSFVPMDAQLKP